MAIMRYAPRSFVGSPWRDLEEVSNRLARMFDDNSATGNAPANAWMPSVNVEETKDELVLSAELPGMTGDDISIDVENNVLTISGEKTEERTEGDEERRYHVWERRYGTFQRSFTLPRSVKADDIRAHFANGILRIRMPKVAEAKGRKIQVEATK